MEDKKLPETDVETDEVLEEEADGDVVELESDDGESVKFRHVATIDHENDWYVLFSPVEAIDGVGEDEVVIFKLGADENGGDVFIPVEDDAILDAVYDEYVRIMEEEGDWEECDCEEGCDCDHDGDGKCACHSCDCDDCKHEN